MKKLLSILLVLALCLSTMTTAFASAQPSEDDSAEKWEEYAEYIEQNGAPGEAAEYYFRAAQKYAEHIGEDERFIDAAISCSAKAGELYELIPNFFRVFDSYELLGNIAFDCHLYEEAKDAYCKAVNLVEDVSIDENRLSNVYGRLGDVYRDFGMYKEAAEQYEAALKLLDPFDGRYAYFCQVYAEMLEAYGLPDDPEGEIKIGKAFETAAGEWVTNGIVESSIVFLRRSCEHYGRVNELELAQEAYCHIINLLAENAFEEQASQLCFELFNNYGLSEFAATMFTDVAAPYYESIEDYASLALVYRNAGECYSNIDNKDLAEACYLSAAEYYEKAGDTENAEAMREYIGLGSILSGGNVKIIIAIAAVAVLILVILFIKKRKK